VASEAGAHPGLSGIYPLRDARDAFAARVLLARTAERSLDVQYYIWHDDLSGKLLFAALREAADRGVRVRLLLDDNNTSGLDPTLAALDAHPNIEVRLFNPFVIRASRLWGYLTDFSRLNRRMHNKSFVADNSAAIIGGRNIGDDYFDAGTDTNFRDLDLLAIGPVVREASRVFDDYWNSDAAYPATAFSNDRDTQADLVQLRVALARDARAFAQSDYAQATLDELPDGATADRRGEWFWGSAVVVADQPEKIEMHEDVPSLRIGPQLKAMIDTAQNEVFMTSPYFVPGDTGTQFLTALAQRGVRIQVLTNSLAATDETAAHSGYAHYRRQLLEGGVQLYELRPTPGTAQPVTARGTSSGVSLHAKTVVVDRRKVFIGSLNMDQRSKLLNTEMGLIIDSAPLAQAVREFFDNATLPANSYQVSLLQPPTAKPGEAPMSWQWSEDGHAMSGQSDPGVSKERLLAVFLMKLLPIEGLL
jgi:putative cardiolipin synthase